ncbi:hypothetical protein HXX76_000238 [Chlamydomonas incerta]|uniref:Uncharacterized protein n=1 Tax=Chlamydomonas incerta TaxID=51695 RepID=A0A836B2N3_CHLIN|nr:hypothetical protein HXX76_000238 [Chlamydomonas incerta]|eukprot:KAG2445628.1 hypothetical protein HXX76_000238 [Chlamydomonas incerta]
MARQWGRGAQEAQALTDASGPGAAAGVLSRAQAAAAWRWQWTVAGPEHLRRFLSWSACGHLAGVTLLDLSRMPALPISRDTWAALVRALGGSSSGSSSSGGGAQGAGGIGGGGCRAGAGEGDGVTLRVPWRCLLAHGTAGAGGGGGGRGGGGNGGAGGSKGAAAKAAKAAAKAAAAAAVLARLQPGVSVELAGRGLPIRSPALLAPGSGFFLFFVYKTA